MYVLGGVRVCMCACLHARLFSTIATKFDEPSLEKAFVVLNAMIENVWIESDENNFNCRGFGDLRLRPSLTIPHWR